MKKEVIHYPLDKIENPEFLMDLSYKDLDVLSTDITDGQMQPAVRILYARGGDTSSFA